MQRVMTEMLATGMVLADVVRNSRGDVLIAAGTVLEPHHLRGLRTSGIDSVLIRGDEAATDNAKAVEYPPELLEAARARVAPRFTRCGTSHPVLAFLAEEAARRQAAAMTAEGNQV